MIGWLKSAGVPKAPQPQVSLPVAVHEAPPSLPSRNFGWRIAVLAGRLGYLARHAMNAENAQKAQTAEVEARVSAMAAEIVQANLRMTEGMSEANGLRERAQQNLAASNENLFRGLTALDRSLSEKLRQIGHVIKGLEKIGKDLDLLALNAAIQAANAGEAGRSFSVVAEHVRELARHTVDNAQEAATLLDFRDFQRQLVAFRETSSENARQSGQETDAAFTTVQSVFETIRHSLELLEAHSRVIETMHDLSQNTYDRQRRKMVWIKESADNFSRMWGVNDMDLMARLDGLLASEGMQASMDFDRLDDIRRRGVLRVAIEPAFKGLSFRMRPGEPLQGLDVDYAKAFAAYLGVKVEFIEYPWDQCTELLYTGTARGKPEADLVWSALPPNVAYQGVAFSEAYTYLHYVLAKRVGDSGIRNLQSLEGKVLGCINDPAAFATLEAAGLRWSKHDKDEPGTVRLANLIGYSDQAIIHDALAGGAVDAFAVDQPIFAWACYGQDSPWRNRIEIAPGNIASAPWYYAVGVADTPTNYKLLSEINRFIAAFKATPERQAIEKRWQFTPVQGSGSYREEPGHLRGEDELRKAWEAMRE